MTRSLAPPPPPQPVSGKSLIGDIIDTVQGSVMSAGHYVTSPRCTAASAFLLRLVDVGLSQSVAPPPFSGVPPVPVCVDGFRL